MGVIFAYIYIGIMAVTVLGTFVYILYLDIKNDREEAKKSFQMTDKNITSTTLFKTIKYT
jgi:hypothetical protein